MGRLVFMTQHAVSGVTAAPTFRLADLIRPPGGAQATVVMHQMGVTLVVLPKDPALQAFYFTQLTNARSHGLLERHDAVTFTAWRRLPAAGAILFRLRNHRGP